MNTTTATKVKLCYYTALLIIMIYKFTHLISIPGLHAPGPIMLMPAALLLTAVILFLSKISIVNILLICLAFLSYHVSDDYSLMLFLLLIMASKRINMDDVMRFWFGIQSVFVIPCILLYLPLHLVGSPLAATMVISGRTKCTFFFAHPNNFGIQMVFWLFAYVYINYFKLKKRKVIFIMLASTIFLLIFPKVYSAAIALVSFLLLYLLQGKWKHVWKIVSRCALPLLLLFAVYMTWTISTGRSSILTEIVQDTFRGRFAGASYALQRYPLNMFGHQMKEIGTTVLDNDEWVRWWYDLAYLRVFSAFGMVGGLCFLFMLLRTIYIDSKRKNNRDLLFLLVVCIYALSEWTAFSIPTAFPLLFTYVALQKRGKTVSCKEGLDATVRIRSKY